MPTIKDLEKQLEEQKKENKKLQEQLLAKAKSDAEEQIQAEDEAKKGLKQTYYEVVVHNKDVAEGAPDYIDFFANDKRVIIKPGLNVLLSNTAYENLTKRCIQKRYRLTIENNENKLESYNYRRFPVVLIKEFELTEEEREKEVARINKENEKRKIAA
jgi:hypothetical protein